MRSVQVWTDKVSDKEKNYQCIYDIAFHPSGDTFIATAGNKVLVYDAKEGQLLHTLKGHRDSVNCLTYSRDGLNFASGGADKTVIIWTSQPPDGHLKYTHSDSVQCISFNPVSQQLVSCTASEVGLWTSEQKSVTKSKIFSKACCCSWTNDGQYFAVGHYNGVITIWTKNGEEKVKIDRPGGLPVWALSWNPSREDQYDILTVCDWGQKLSYYFLNGKQISKDRNLGYDPTCVSYFPNGEFAIITGSSNKASIYSREGVYLGALAEQESWVWTCKPRPGQNNNQVVIGCQDGTIALYQMTFNTVHGLYKDRYAYRESMTEVVVKHLITNDSIRIKCKDHIKKIAIYKDRLAVQFPEKIAVYEVTGNDPTDLNYRLKDRINKQVECSLLVVCSNNVVLCQERKLQCLSFTGEKEREWILESQIRYIKVVGGPPNREGMLVGLRNGQIFKIFVDNPFPILLLKQQTAIRCLDLSASRNKLAVVDDSGTLSVYNLPTKELLFQEPNANSVAWNTQYEDMLCYSGGGLLSIKASNFPVHQQRQQGFVVGFTGSRIFCLFYFSMTSIDVPQSASMIQYLERKNYREAYKIACLGVTDGDWKILALEALEGMDLDVAKKAFIRVRDLRFLELIHKIEERKKIGENNIQLFLADVYAYQGKFQEAAELYRKAGHEDKAVEMFTDLCQFDRAKEFASFSGKHDVKSLITKQADWAKDTNDPRAACDMYLAAGELLKAVEIMGQNGWVERILNLVHDVDKSETELLQSCAQHLKNLSQYNSAAEVYEKLDDVKALATLYIDTQQWNYAFELARKHPEFKTQVYMPYATWLVENDRFEEAQDALSQAGRQSEAANLLRHLAENAVVENRFSDAGHYYWILSKTNLEASKRESLDPEGSSLKIEELVSKFHEYMELSELYYVYHRIYSFVEQPFTSHIPEALHNMARFLAHRIMKTAPPGISKVSTYFTLAKQSKQLGAYKLARHAFEKLQTLIIPPSLRETVNLGTITIRAKPFQDKEDLLPMCYRCSTTNPLLNTAGNQCVNCKQPFEFSFISFEVLPVVEFVLEKGISDEEAMKLIQKEPSRESSKEQWKETQSGNVQSLKLDDYSMTNGEVDDDPFSEGTFEGVSEFSPVVVGRKVLQNLHRTEVLVKKWGPPVGNQYYRSILPDVSITICSTCNKMFHTDDYELQVLLKGHCPFCRKMAQSLRTMS